MADIAVGTVTPGATSDNRSGTAGGTIASGDPLRVSALKLVPAQADSSTTATVVGVALHDAEDGQPIAYSAGGKVAIASVATIGTVYVLSAAAPGGIAPWADLVQGNIVTVLGVATAATVLDLKILNSGAAIP